MDQEGPLARSITLLEHRLAARDESVIPEVVASCGDAVLNDLQLRHGSKLDRDERIECLHRATLIAFQAKQPYDPRQASAATYLKRQADYAAREYVRRRAQLWARLVAEVSVDALVAARSANPAVSLLQAEAKVQLQEAIMRLDEKYRVAIGGWMRFGEEHYRKAIAQELPPVRPELVGQWFVRGKEQLKELLGPGFHCAD